LVLPLAPRLTVPVLVAVAGYVLLMPALPIRISLPPHRIPHSPRPAALADVEAEIITPRVTSNEFADVPVAGRRPPDVDHVVFGPSAVDRGEAARGAEAGE
jgi:hypothetical protein